MQCYPESAWERYEKHGFDGLFDRRRSKLSSKRGPEASGGFAALVWRLSALPTVPMWWGAAWPMVNRRKIHKKRAACAVEMWRRHGEAEDRPLVELENPDN